MEDLVHVKYKGCNIVKIEKNKHDVTVGWKFRKILMIQWKVKKISVIPKGWILFGYYMINQIFVNCASIKYFS